MAIVRLRRTISAGELVPLTFDFSKDMAASESVSSPEITQVRLEGTHDLVLSTPTIESGATPKRVSTSLECREESVGYRGTITCLVAIGDYDRKVSASVIQT